MSEGKGKTAKCLIPALRQYRHNHGGDELIAGFDYDETHKVVRQLQERNLELEEICDELGAALDQAAKGLNNTAAKIKKLERQLRVYQDTICNFEPWTYSQITFLQAIQHQISCRLRGVEVNDRDD
jgi:DNA repair ATPase RecN